MTTIVPDQSTEEGKKLAAYQPGETVEIELEVVENKNGQLSVEVTKCEPAEEEASETETEGETPMEHDMPMPSKSGKKGVPNAIVIALGHGK